MVVTVGVDMAAVDATGAPETMMDAVAAEMMVGAADGMIARQRATFLAIAGDRASAVPAPSHPFQMIRVPTGMAATGGQALEMAAADARDAGGQMAVVAAVEEAPVQEPAS